MLVSHLFWTMLLGCQTIKNPKLQMLLRIELFTLIPAIQWNLAWVPGSITKKSQIVRLSTIDWLKWQRVESVSECPCGANDTVLLGIKSCPQFLKRWLSCIFTGTIDVFNINSSNWNWTIPEYSWRKQAVARCVTWMMWIVNRITLCIVRFMVIYESLCSVQSCK